MARNPSPISHLQPTYFGAPKRDKATQIGGRLSQYCHTYDIVSSLFSIGYRPYANTIPGYPSVENLKVGMKFAAVAITPSFQKYCSSENPQEKNGKNTLASGSEF